MAGCFHEHCGLWGGAQTFTSASPISPLFKSNTLKVGSLVVLSRFGGLIRDSLLATFLGGGWVADAYTTALRIPNMLRDLLGEGALSSVVVARLGQVEEQRQGPLVRQLMGFWLLVLGCVCLAGILLAPHLVGWIAGGLEGEAAELTTDLTRILFPYILLVGLAAMTMGILHQRRIFGWSTSASSFGNLTVIFGMLLIGNFVAGEAHELAYWISACVLLAGLAQWCSQFPGLRGTGLKLWPSFRFTDPEVKRVFALLGPSVLAVSAVQINVMVNVNYASELKIAGGLAALYFSFRLMQLPVGIVGVAVSTVLLPTLTDMAKGSKVVEMGREMGGALAGVLFLALPAVGGLWVLGPDLIALLYEHGRFDAAATERVWTCLQGFLWGILPYAFNKNLMQGFFAHSDTRTPLVVSTMSIGVNAALNHHLAFNLGWGLWGLTLGTSGVLAFNTLGLWLGLQWKHGIVLPIGELMKNVVLCVLLSCAMVGTLMWLRPMLTETWPLVRVVILTSAGAMLYLGPVLALKVLLGWDLRRLGLNSSPKRDS